MLAVSTIQVLFNEDDKKRLGIQTDTVNSGWSLSLGTRIGIAVGVGCFILLCMALIYYVLARRRRFREGLTKERLIRDLKSIHRRNSPDNGPYINTVGMSVANAGPYLTHEQHDPPPPAYDPRSRGPVGNRPGDSIRPTEGEIRALNEQKAMIQQRLDELESLDIRRNGPRTGS